MPFLCQYASVSLSFEKKKEESIHREMLGRLAEEFFFLMKISLIIKEFSTSLFTCKCQFSNDKNTRVN